MGDTMTSLKFNQSRKLSFQQLENRMLMAGNVAVSLVQNHSLNITGDNHGNSFEIIQTGNGQYTIIPSESNNGILPSTERQHRKRLPALPAISTSTCKEVPTTFSSMAQTLPVRYLPFPEI